MTLTPTDAGAVRTPAACASAAAAPGPGAGGNASGPAARGGAAGPLVPPERAAWIRAHAWPAWMRAMDADYEHGCFLFRLTNCQLGPCVSCRQDRHDLCLTRQHSGRPLGWDMEIYAWTAGRQPIDGRSVANVTVKGRSGLWRCPCTHPEAQAAATVKATPTPPADRVTPTRPEPVGALW